MRVGLQSNDDGPPVNPHGLLSPQPDARRNFHDLLAARFVAANIPDASAKPAMGRIGIPSRVPEQRDRQTRNGDRKREATQSRAQNCRVSFRNRTRPLEQPKLIRVSSSLDYPLLVSTRKGLNRAIGQTGPHRKPACEDGAAGRHAGRLRGRGRKRRSPALRRHRIFRALTGRTRGADTLQCRGHYFSHPVQKRETPPA